MLPLVDENVRFVGPWQEGFGRAKYRPGAAGFHCLFSCDLDVRQVGVDESHQQGRAIVDGIMNL